MSVAVLTLLLAEAFVANHQASLATDGVRCNSTKNKLSLLKKNKLDPHCRDGIMSVDMEHCCQKDCGECSDESDICNAKATNGRGSTCCPSDMLAADLPSCENSKAPCAIPAYVRAAPDVSELKSAEGDRTAIDDCGESVPDERNRHLLATHFIHFPGDDVSRTSASATECGAIGEMSAMAASCDKRDDCMGFTVNDGTPDCMLIAGSAVETLSGGASNDVYLKVEGLGGRRFVFNPMPFSGECSKSCGGGEQTRDLKCKSCKSAEATEKNCEGLEVPLGLCSAQVAMNGDAMPETSLVCNDFACDSPCGDLSMVVFHMPSAGGYPGEVHWHVSAGVLAPAEGESLTGNEGACEGGAAGAACCIDASVEEVHVECYDSFGDGWNGASFYVNRGGDDNGTPICDKPQQPSGNIMWGTYYYGLNFPGPVEDTVSIPAA